MSEQRKSLKWRTRLLMLLIAFSVAPIAGFAVWVSSTLETTFRDSTIDSLEALASAKAEAIDQFTDYRRSDVERIATLLAPYLNNLHEAEADGGAQTAPPSVDNLPQLPDPQNLPAPDAGPDTPQLSPMGDANPGSDARIDAPDAGGKPADGKPTRTDGTPTRTDGTPARTDGTPTRTDGTPARTDGTPARTDGKTVDGRLELAVEQARDALQQPLGLILWDQKEFEELLVIDPSGRVVASTFDDHEGLSAAKIEYFEQGRKTTYVQGVFVSPITKQLTMVIATPIRDDNHREIGVLAARLNLDRFFRLIGDRTGLGHTGETIVGKKIQSDLVLMAPTRHASDAALRLTIPIGSPRARGLQEAAREQSGSGETPDYRGVRTLAAWQYIPSLEWGLLVKIDYTESMVGVTRARRAMLYLLVAILVFATLGSFIVSRAFIRPLQELKVATDRISRGDLNVQLAIRSQDEIGQLADSFERMVASIKYYRERSARHAAAEDSDEPDASDELPDAPAGVVTPETLPDSKA